jgi:hypothetical protein
MLKRIAAFGLAAVSVGIMSAVVVGAPASASLATCYTTTGLDTSAYGPVSVPSAGSTADSTSCAMSLNANSSAVSRLQQTLNKCNGQSISEDGQFGPATKSALQAAQRLRGVTGDGVYGPVTRDALRWWTGGWSSSGTAICPNVNGPGGL